MNINEVIVQSLAPLGIPVAFQSYQGQADTYITFFTFLDQPEQWADDIENLVGAYVQVDVWSKNDPADVAQHVHEALAERGFRRKSTADLSEDELKMYHKASRYVVEYRAPSSP